MSGVGGGSTSCPRPPGQGGWRALSLPQQLVPGGVSAAPLCPAAPGHRPPAAVGASDPGAQAAGKAAAAGPDTEVIAPSAACAVCSATGDGAPAGGGSAGSGEQPAQPGAPRAAPRREPRGAGKGGAPRGAVPSAPGAASPA